MPFYLRKVKRAFWLREPYIDWLSEDSFPADSLNDFATVDNKISLWLIEDDKNNLERVLGAIGSNRSSVQEIDYLLIDSGVFKPIAERLLNSPSNTPDHEANELWHYDAVQLTGKEICHLGRMIFGNYQPVRVKPREVSRILNESIDQGVLSLAEIDNNILGKLKIKAEI